MFNLSKLTKAIYPLRNSPLGGNVSQHIASPMPFVSLTNIQKHFFAGRPSAAVKDTSNKEITKAFALSDEKEAKLSKAEEEAELKRKKLMAELARKKKEQEALTPFKTQNIVFENRITKKQLTKMVENMQKKQLGLVEEEEDEEEREREKLFQEQLRAKLKADRPQRERRPRVPKVKEPEPVLTLNTMPKKPTPRLKKKVVQSFYNTEAITNKRFQLQSIEVDERNTKRTGVIAKKVGMTALFDRWGVRHALTVLQIDRCQVVQIKTEKTDGYTAMQLGAGERNYKRVRKPEIGHYLKAGVPAKRVLKEFHVSPECLLPVGFQMGARHFVPGQYVDVSGVSIGKGFQGTVVKYGFKMQPATHGNSRSHRALGSTGQRQDAGRVFKNRKMPGRMGGVKRTVANLQVYKIDAPRALVYVSGSVPGKPGTFCYLRDAIRKKTYNFDYLNFPTFIPKAGEKYANEIIMRPSDTDPFEEYLHDNDVIDKE